MVTFALFEHWVLNSAIVSRSFRAIRWLEREFIATAWKLNPANRIVALTKASLDTRTGSGKVIPLVPESVLRGAVASLSRTLYLSFSQFLPGPGEFTLAFVALAGSMGPAWIPKFTKRLRVSRHFELFSRNEQERVEVDLFDENVEITLRIDNHGFDIFRKPECTVTIFLPKKDSCSSEEQIGNASDPKEARLKEHDHKLPFWVK